MASAGTKYAKYVGRVGALAVALGVTGAVATTPGIAWADDVSSTESAGSTSSPSDQASPSAVDPSPSATGTPTAPDEPPSTDSTDGDSAANPGEVTNEPTESSETVTTHGGGVIVRASGGAHTSETDVGGGFAGDHIEDVSDAVVDDEGSAAAASGSDDEIAAEVANDSDPVTTNTADAPAISTFAAQTAPPPTDTNVSVKRVEVFAPQLPTPTEVVQRVRETVTACACGIINGTVKLINAAMAAIAGGGAAGPAGPASPAGNPLLAAVLEWARRESNRVVEALSRTPIARFVHDVSMRVTEAVTDFGNSPVGRQLSARFTQFLQQCQESTSLPADLERVTIVEGLTEPTDFAFLADAIHADEVHRIFITEKSGAIKVFNPDDGTVATVTTLPTVTADGERGLVGIEVDPRFWTWGADGYHTIYVAYTGEDNYDRLSKITLSDDLTALSGPSELMKSTELGNNFHHGGELQFDADGEYLYWAVGDNTESTNAQDLSNIHGKILRLDRNGDAPEDNPFFDEPDAVKQIYAIGLRNPFRFTFTSDGTLLVGDVGEADWEELNVVTAGGNYGWPEYEGECSGCEFVNPIYAYRHSAPPANAGSITAVLAYTGTTLPANYRNKVFIADYSTGWIKELTFDDAYTSLISERTFDNKAGTVVKLDQGPDGNVYQLNIYPGQLSIIRASSGNRAPTAVISASATYTSGDSLEVQFSSGNSTDPEGQNLRYEWDFGNGRTSTDANPTMAFTNAGAEYTAYTVTLTVSDGDKTSTASQRIVVGSTPPTVSITDIPDRYNAGDTVAFDGVASDDEDGALPDDAYKWTVVFHHAEHVHPFRDNIIGPTGTVAIPRTRDQLGNTFYRVSLTVTDSSGLSTTTYKDVMPNTVRLAINASDPDAGFTVDGTRYTGSYIVEKAVVGVEYTLNALSPQPDSGGQLVFDRWSDGGAQSHTITAPETDATYTAYYNLVPSATTVALT